ncbi:voltage-dependent anion-selective channel [Drosophila santomea]|uniref:voltage-dependent anion-selective channel n=1 Tax=Drosophila santomea TaxID=129105 RepID=UPI001954922C|nr:voltage-dependent anion-selective channel [Drosophila santomea]
MTNMKQRLRNLFRRNKMRTRATTVPSKKESPEPAKQEEPSKKSGKQDASKQEPPKEEEPEKPAKDVEVEIIPMPPAEGEMPTYFHVGALAKDCLINGFKIGAWQMQCTTRTDSDFYLSTFGEGYPTMTSVFGGMEVFKEVGIYSTSLGWFTNNDLLSEIGVRGMNFGSRLYGLLKSTIGTKDEVTFQTKLKCGLERDPVKVELVVPLYNEPLFLGYVLVAPVENWVLGYRTQYNCDEKGFDKHALCLGYNNGRTEVGLKLENFEDLRGSIFQRIGEAWAFAIKANLYSSENVKQFAIGLQYDFQNGTMVKAKLREDSRLGFVYQSKIGKNIDVGYHLAFNGADPIGGAHRIGVSWGFHC